MSNTSPVYTQVPNLGFGLTSVTSQPALEGIGLLNSTQVLGAALNPVKINEIDVTPTQTTLVGTVNIFLVDPIDDNFYLIDQVPIAAQALTTGVPMTSWKKPYANLVLPAGWGLVVTQTCAGAQGLICVVAHGADF
jgi:hypothetical protein